MIETKTLFSGDLSLIDRLRELEAVYGKTLPTEVVTCIVHYILDLNDGRTFRKVDRKFDFDGLLTSFRRDRLEYSYYLMGHLWRAVYRVVSNRSMNCKDFGVSPADVRLCVSILSPDVQNKIRQWSIGHSYVVVPNEAMVNQVVDSCRDTIRIIVSTKLRFLTKYDPAFEFEDFESDLRITAFKVAQKYDWETVNGSEFALAKCTNFTKRSLWNAAYLRIRENTSESYNRLRSVESDSREYLVTTVSMDSPSEEDALSIKSKLAAEPDDTFEIVEFIANVQDPKLGALLKLEVEDNVEFNNFLQSRGFAENELYRSNYLKWSELAREFVGISNEEYKNYQKTIGKDLIPF